MPLPESEDSPLPQPPVRGRHRRRDRGRGWLVGALAFGVASAGTAGVLALRPGRPSAAAPRCALAGTVLRVTASPDIADVVRSVAGRMPAGGCPAVRVEVSAATASDVLAGMQRRTRPDVWIPDSSLWAADAGARPVTGPSIAQSPIVLAVSAPAARSLGGAPTLARLAAAATTASPVLLAADPDRSAASVGILTALTSAPAGPAQLGDLAALLRTAALAPRPDPNGRPAPLARGGTPVAVPTTEQAVKAADRGSASPKITAVYPPAPGPVLDYPYLVLAHDASARRAAQALLRALTGSAGRAALQSAGFQSPGAGSAPTAPQQTAVRRTLQLAQEPSRLLALIDVSGSMGLPVPGAPGRTRISLARDAAAEGLRVLPPGSAAGLWTFSADLTATTDYREEVPVTPLTGSTRRRLAAAVGSLAYLPGGGTGLYDSVLAAVDSVRSGWDPTRVNSVVVLTDGKDEADADHRIPLSALLTALRQERASTRPVKVIAIAYGPDSDLAALRAISAASGGILYRSTDPRDLPKIFVNAVGHRLCGQACR